MFATACARLRPGVFILLCYLAGCATAPQSARLREQLPPNLPSAVELAAVPFFPQQAYQCGPAALATVLQAQGVDVVPDKLVDKVYIPQRYGSLQTEMVAAGRAHGMLPYPLPPRLDALLAEVAGGHPVLVLQNLGLEWLPRWHYAVVVGYDLEKGVLILRSGTTRRHITTLPTFEHTWRRADYWGYVMLLPHSMPVTATPVAYLGAAFALENTGRQGEALVAYRQAAGRWPENRIVLMALGNAEYTAGEFARAGRAFRQVIRRQSLDADAWNNLAYALAARHCMQEARQALACAQSLAPEDENIQHSIKELGAGQPEQGSGCRPVVCPAMNDGS